MPERPFGIGEPEHGAAIRRGVRKPVDVTIVRHPPRVGAIDAHPPDLGGPASVGIEPDRRAVGGVIRAVVVAGVFGQPALGAAAHRDREHVEPAAAPAAEGKRRPVRRPSVPERMRLLGHRVGRAPRRRQRVDRRALGEVVADDDAAGIRRDPVVVVAGIGEAGVHRRQLRPTVERHTPQPPGAVDEQARAVGVPVRRLDQALGLQHDADAGRGDVMDFERTSHLSPFSASPALPAVRLRPL